MRIFGECNRLSLLQNVIAPCRVQLLSLTATMQYPFDKLCYHTYLKTYRGFRMVIVIRFTFLRTLRSLLHVRPCRRQNEGIPDSQTWIATRFVVDHTMRYLEREYLDDSLLLTLVHRRKHQKQVPFWKGKTTYLSVVWMVFQWLYR